MILVLDNYDSFVYNLARYVSQLGKETLVQRSDAITINEIKGLNPEAIVISPGPCTPNEAGVSLEVVRHFAEQIPILGVCLGHQSIGQAFGGRIVKAQQPAHGKARRISHNGKGIYKNIPDHFNVARYHSLVIDPSSLPVCLEITSVSDEDEIMSVRHKQYPTVGVQYHPESIITQYGYELIKNFLVMADAHYKQAEVQVA